MADDHYTITNLDREILSVCTIPRHPKDIARDVGSTLKTVQWKLFNLRKLGALEQIRVNSRVYMYVRVEGASLPDRVDTKKEYKPLGMCIMGVWL
jgi:hypothetical protein